MKTIMRVLISLAMFTVLYIPAFSQSSIWSNDGMPTGFGNRKDGENITDDDGINNLAVGEEVTPVHDGWVGVMGVSFLYGIYLVRRNRRTHKIKIVVPT